MLNRCLHLMEGGKLDSRCCFSNAFNCALSLSHKEKSNSVQSCCVCTCGIHLGNCCEKQAKWNAHGCDKAIYRLFLAQHGDEWGDVITKETLISSKPWWVVTPLLYFTCYTA